MIAYYFGAGASYGTKGDTALPLVYDLPGRLKDMATNSPLSFWYKEKYGENQGLDFKKKEPKFPPQDEKETIDDFISNLLWLYDKCKSHISIDTFAKKLFIINDEKSLLQLKRLKATLSAYFILEQAQKFDKRYDAFFAAIIKKDAFDLPSKLRIISWNYDWQFEIAYSAFCGFNDINGIQSKLNVRTKFSENKYDEESNRFSLTKINGSCGFYNAEKEQFGNYIDSVPDANHFDELVENVLHAYKKFLYNENTSSTLSFSWEDESVKRRNIHSGIISRAIETTRNTNVLVVIGYSFPYFNRDADREIIGSMKNLTKVYIQSPDADKTKIRFRSVLPTFDVEKIIPWTECEQFLIPDEY